MSMAAAIASIESDFLTTPLMSLTPSVAPLKERSSVITQQRLSGSDRMAFEITFQGLFSLTNRLPCMST